MRLKDFELIFKKNSNRILHWQDNGETNWYEIASTISKLGKEMGLIKNNQKIIPIKTSQYSSKVKRPPYSLLECKFTKNLLNYEGMHWKITLKEILEEIQNKKNNTYFINSRFQI